jgi:biopolymer transport protein ExbD
VLRIANEGKVFLNGELQNRDTIAFRLAEIYTARESRILYVSADDNVPFQTLADPIDIAQNARVGTWPLNIRVLLISSTVINPRCPGPVCTGLTYHASR